MENLSTILLHMILLSWIHMTVTLVPNDQPTYDDQSCDNDNTTDEIIDESGDYYDQEVEVRATEVDVTYHFYSKTHPGGVSMKHTSAQLLDDTDFSVDKYTLFIIHGWKGDRDSHFNYHVKEALLGRHDINLFAVDWSPVAQMSYFTAQGAVLKVGNFIATFIKSLVSIYGLNLATVGFVGHSLGAHVSGNAGAALGGQVEYIVGLDPASPFFSLDKIDNRLDKSDAKFVQAIHTNGGRLGIWGSIGHSDYYPNGGTRQVGCGYDLLGACAHARAWSYYAESVAVKKNLFVARRCCSYKAYRQGKCRERSSSVMAGYPIDTKASGKYYLKTNESPPFGKG